MHENSLSIVTATADAANELVEQLEIPCDAEPDEMRRARFLHVEAVTGAGRVCRENRQLAGIPPADRFVLGRFALAVAEIG